MDPIYEEKMLFGLMPYIKVFPTRITVKKGFFEKSIILKQVVSVEPANIMGQVVLHMTGGDEITISTWDKVKLCEAIAKAIDMNR